MFVNDLCASFQRAVTDVLVQKTLRAAREVGAKVVAISGGVSCNHELRERMQIACEEARLKFVSAKPELCTDNAAMIAFVALLRLQAGFTSRVEEDIDPNLFGILSGAGSACSFGTNFTTSHNNGEAGASPKELILALQKVIRERVQSLGFCAEDIKGGMRFFR